MADANEVIRFVCEQTGLSDSCVSSSSDLVRDVGLDGDDALEFFDAFSRRFGVDVSCFDPKRYFGPEGGCFPFSMLVSYMWRKPPSLTVGDLVKATETGVLQPAAQPESGRRQG